MPGMRGEPGAELFAALHAKLSALGVEAILEESTGRSWASATFEGMRHELSIRISGAGAATAADIFLADLSTGEFALRGHVVADIGLLCEQRFDGGGLVVMQLEALTVED